MGGGREGGRDLAVVRLHQVRFFYPKACRARALCSRASVMLLVLVLLSESFAANEKA